ncbi:hypothetical protein C8J56DRAFT_1063662 [Mycena floridula]|nr:hypothetical protein C8J56DRAFT_1068950 [Mycena floridula]KAJ7575423.1 hypothetical protein C8J56DRAFT_1063662 [Mycena floridula]
MRFLGCTVLWAPIIIAIELIPLDVGRLVAHMCQPDETGNLYDPFSRATVVSASLTSTTMRGFFLEKLTGSLSLTPHLTGSLGIKWGFSGEAGFLTLA